MMKQKLSAICVALCAVLLFAVLLTGCNNNVTGTATPTPSEATFQVNYMNAGETYRILIWNTFRENQPLEQDQPGNIERNAKVSELKEKYDITATYVKASNNWLEDAKAAALTGEPLCDVIHAGQPGALPGLYSYNGMAGSVVESITALELEDLFSDEQHWNVEFNQACGYYNGELYFVIPQETGFGSVGLHQVTFFNKEMLAAAGYTKETMYELSDNGQWTFDKLREVCIALTDADKGTYGMCMGATSIAMCSMVTSNGGSFLTKDENGVDRYTVATDNKALNAVNFFVKMAKEDGSVYLGNYVDEEIKGFNTGKYGIMLTYANRAQQMNELEEKVDFGVIMPPKGPDATEYISEVNWYDAWCVMKNTANPKGSVEFMSYMIASPYGRDSQQNMMLLQSEADIVCSDNESVQNLINVRDYSKATTYQTYCWLSEPGSGFGFGNGILYCCLQFIDGTTTPEVYFASVTDAANAIIDSMVASK